MKPVHLLAIGLSALFACTSGGDDTSTDDTSVEGDDTEVETDDTDVETDDTSADDTETPEPVSATLSGTVSVQLYVTDSQGERHYRSWEESGYATWPFGKIFVSSYQTDEQGGRSYVGDTTIDAPTFPGDAWSMDVELDAPGELVLYGQLDRDADRFLVSGSDPVGYYPDEVEISVSGPIGDLDIVILARDPADIDNNNGGLGDGSGSGCAGTVGVTGEVAVVSSYGAGDVVSWFEDVSGGRPYLSRWATPTPNGGGATADYSYTVCANAGAFNLRGAWDRNLNGLVDPRDRFGAYASSPDVNGNPVTIEASDLAGYDIQIPLGSQDGFSIVPFTRLEGAVRLVTDLAFDAELPENATVYVAALRYRPDTDLSVASMIEQSYDYETRTWEELAGLTSFDFSLGVPGNAVVYLWAYADDDNNGSVNGVGEHVATPGGSSTGRMGTGDGVSGIDLALGQP